VITEDVFTLRAAQGEDPGNGRLRHTGYIPEFAEELVNKRYLSVEVFR